MLDCVNHKLESRLLGEVSITSDMQMTPPLDRKWRGVKKLLEESEKAGLKLSIQRTKIMASGPIISRQIDGETMETVRGFILQGSKVTADGDCSHEIKTLVSWRKSYDQPRQHIKKQRRYFANKSQSHGFSSSHVWMEKAMATPLQCSCLENPRDGGAWWAAIYAVAQSQTRLKWLSSSRQHIKKQRHYFANKGLSSQSFGFFQ